MVKGEVRLSEERKKVPSLLYLRIISEEVAMLHYVFREIICV